MSRTSQARRRIPKRAPRSTAHVRGTHRRPRYRADTGATRRPLPGGASGPRLSSSTSTLSARTTPVPLLVDDVEQDPLDLLDQLDALETQDEVAEMLENINHAARDAGLW